MKIKAAVGVALLGVLIGAHGAQATGSVEEDQDRQTEPKYERTFGRALPPVGYVNFCARNGEACQPQGGRAAPLAMSPERWNLIYQVNTYVNGKVAPVSDSELYGEAEYWAFASDAGDCEDYVLLKQRYLEGLGFGRSALLITVVLDEKNEGHAVLTVATEDGDFVLDNRRNEIRRWSDVEYTFLKRQSARDPRQWIALTDTKAPAATVASGTDK
jgi:predicted transglutaminase-like cysteine proteinase